MPNFFKRFGTAALNRLCTDLFWHTATIEEVQYQLNRPGVHVNVVGIEGWTPLLYAVKHSNNRSIIELLLDSGADIEARNDKGGTPLLIAVAEGKLEIAALLLNRGADIEAKTNEGFTALMSAVTVGNSSLLQLLLTKGANTEERDYQGIAALHHAVLWCDEDLGREAVIGILLMGGSDSETRTENGYTALHLAAAQKSRAVSLLVAGGADLEAKSYDGYTPLQLAVVVGNSDSARALVVAGAERAS